MKAEKIVYLTLLWCTLVCVPVLVSTQSTTACSDINCFAWNYKDLGESSGWWAKWFPACAADNQSPINIDDTKVQPTKDRITITPVHNKPFQFIYVTVYPQSLYNVLHYSIFGKDLRVKILRESSSAAETTRSESSAASPIMYDMKSIRIQFPAEHTINGERVDAEVRYTFEKNTDSAINAKGNNDEKNGNGNIGDATNKDRTYKNVVLTALGKMATKEKPRNEMDVWLKYMTGDISAGSIKKYVKFPHFKNVYVYNGSLSYPPCTPDVLYIVGTEIMSIKPSTMQGLRALNVSGMGVREIKDIGERVVELLDFDANALTPVFRTKPSPVRYRLKKVDSDYSIIFLQGYAIYLVLVNIVLFLVLLWLLWERVSYSYQYNLTWQRPTTGQTVFGAAVRYGRETGTTKLRRRRRPAAAEAPSTAATGVTTGATNPPNAKGCKPGC